MIKLAISGAHGRMGQTITKLALQQTDTIEIQTLLEHKNHPKINEKSFDIPVSADNNTLEGCDALIEFTLPEGTLENLKAAVKYKVPMVIGTTGFTKEQEAQIQEASKTIPIVFASNMSIGVNTLFKLIEIASKNLANIQDISIGETHHIHKKDSPSGTAKTMFSIAESFSKSKVRYDEDKIKREGEVVGYHEITFETEFDTLTITHNAKDRSMFAYGSIKAAQFIADKPAGIYTMRNILGLD